MVDGEGDHAAGSGVRHGARSAQGCDGLVIAVEVQRGACFDEEAAGRWQDIGPARPGDGGGQDFELRVAGIAVLLRAKDELHGDDVLRKDAVGRENGGEVQAAEPCTGIKAHRGAR